VILIEGATVLPMSDGDPVIFDGAVLVDGERIAFVGSRVDLTDADRQAVDRVVDARRMVAMPGMIDAHVHLGLHILKGYVEDVDFRELLYDVLYPAEAAIGDEEGRLSTLMGGLEVLKSGATTVLDHYHHGAVTASVVEQLGLRAELAMMALDFDLAAPARDPSRPGGVALDPRFGARELEQNVELALAARGAASRIRWRLGVNTTDTVTDETLRRTAELAHRYGLGVHLHLSQNATEVAFSQQTRGCTPVAYLDRIGLLEVNLAAAHATVLTDDDRRRLARGRGFIAHCPISNAKGGPIMADIPRFLEAGGAVALGTDASPGDMLEVVRHTSVLNKLASRSAAVLPAEQCLRLATIDAAHAIGRGAELGSLEVGKLADLILIDVDQPHLQPLLDVASALVYNARGSDVHTVMVGGEIVVEDRRSVRIDEAAVVHRYTEIAPAFWRRTGLLSGRGR
jgi:5-methylthioadenosine/S-adenosylhomocysteine deaminase